MSSNRLPLGGVLMVCVGLLTACGGGDSQARAERQAPKLASAAVIDGDPYAIACGHVRSQQKWAGVTRRATVAIADRERFRNLTPLLASQSLYYALTEVCRQEPESFKPAQAAVEGVRDGTFRVSRPDHSVD
jgi:hypothetical protein